jgi:hypothetical protein
MSPVAKHAVTAVCCVYCRSAGLLLLEPDERADTETDRKAQFTLEQPLTNSVMTTESAMAAADKVSRCELYLPCGVFTLWAMGLQVLLLLLLQYSC